MWKGEELLMRNKTIDILSKHKGALWIGSTILVTAIVYFIARGILMLVGINESRGMDFALNAGSLCGILTYIIFGIEMLRKAE